MTAPDIAKRFLCWLGIHGPRRHAYMVTRCCWCGTETFNDYMAT